MIGYFETKLGTAGLDILRSMEEDINFNIEQMFSYRAKQNTLEFGVGRATTKIQGYDSHVVDQKRLCDGKILFHAGKALELALQLIYSKGMNRIMGREYDRIDKKQLRKDRSDHNLHSIYCRITDDMKKDGIKEAFEHVYRLSVHQGIQDIVDGNDNVVGSMFMPGQCPFSERNGTRFVDGEEHTVDHSRKLDWFSSPKGDSKFAKMRYDTFVRFLEKADKACYDRNLRWGDYVAREHETCRVYVVVGEVFFARLIQGLVQLGKEPWIWHEDFRDRWLEIRNYNAIRRFAVMVMQNIKNEVIEKLGIAIDPTDIESLAKSVDRAGQDDGDLWGDLLDREKSREYLMGVSGKPFMKGDDAYQSLHSKIRISGVVA